MQQSAHGVRGPGPQLATTRRLVHSLGMHRRLALLSLLVPLAAQESRPRPKAELTQQELFLTEEVDASRCAKHLRILTEDPHMAGTPADRRTAAYVEKVLLEAGFATSRSEYHVLLSYPKRTALELLAPHKHTFDLREKPHAADKDSHDRDNAIAFHGYAKSGIVEGEVVYAHFGRDEDFAWLEEQGVSVQGKVCLIRYGGQFRGLKVQAAQRAGAAGVLLYNDPEEDGYRQGDVYPDGPWRPESGFERGSVQFISTYVGDPLTPGRAATKDAVRIARDEAECLPKIPSLPISSGNAARLLAQLRGRNVPKGWQGGCPHTYHTGPGPAAVRLTVELEEKIAPIWNVHGRLEGTDPAGRYVLVGNHRDAWVHGAIDPNSGSAVTLEAMTALGALVRQGWRPRLSIHYASWDAEEYGLIGSTEWVEEHCAEIQQKCLAYFNVDAAVGGDRLDASASPELVDLLAYAAARTEAHDGKGRLLTRWAHGGTRPPVGNLGSGSDFTAFVCRAGIPCFDLGMKGGHGVYHSIFDDAWTLERYIDPGYKLHATLARMVAIATHRFASAPRAPLEPGALPTHLEAAVRSLPRLAPAHQTALLAAIARLAPATAEPASEQQLCALHAAFLAPEGIASRPWFQNLLVAPGRRLGYGAVVLPGLVEALEAGDERLITREIERLQQAIERAVSILAPR